MVYIKWFKKNLICGVRKRDRPKIQKKKKTMYFKRVVLTLKYYYGEDVEN